MNRVGVGLLLCIALGASALGQPILAFDSVVYDFGTVVEGATVTHAFVITNAGDQALEIKAVRATCGCTATALSKTSLLPGESVSLEATVDTAGFGGSISKVIYVESNDPSSPTAVVHIEGTVTPLAPYNVALTDLKRTYQLLVDIRSAAAYAQAHLLGAVNIPSAYLSLWLDILPRDTLVILYDDDGQGSAAQAKYLQSVGFPYARSLAGGLAAWNAMPNGSDYVIGTPPTLPAPAATPVQAYEIANGVLAPMYVVLIDLRAPSDYASPGGHFLGAVNVPSAELAAWESHLPKDAEVVLYDQTGTESDRQAERLQAAGYENVQGLSGGYDAWVRAFGITYLVAERP